MLRFGTTIFLEGFKLHPKCAIRRKLRTVLTGQLAQELVLVHAVFEGFAAVDEDYWDFVGELAAELLVGVNVNFVPNKACASLKFSQAFFDDFTQVAALARVHDDLAGSRHLGWIVSFDLEGF